MSDSVFRYGVCDRDVKCSHKPSCKLQVELTTQNGSAD